MGIQINGTTDTISATDGSLSVTSSESTFSGISTFNSNLNVIGSTSDDLVRITQTGSGNVLLAEDQTNPDGSPFVITGIGSVGIGVTNPGRLMSIMDSSGPILELGTFNTAANPSIFLHEGTTGSTTNGGGLVYDATNNRLNVVCGATIDTTRMTINRSNGHLGVGTDNPIMRLHVHGDANDASSRIRLSSVEGSGLTIRAQSATENNINADGGEDITFSRGNVESLRIDSSGNVGINTSAPSERLHIIGGSSQSAGTQVDIVRLVASDFSPINSGGLTIGAVWHNTDVSQRIAYLQSSQNIDSGSTNRPLVLNPNGGNVGIATASPETLLDIAQIKTQNDNIGFVRLLNRTVATSSDSNCSLIVENNNVRGQFFAWEGSGLRIGSRNALNTGTGDVNITAGNDVVRLAIDASTGNFTGSSSADISDGRLKENIQDISASDAVNMIKGLQGRTFTWKEEAKMGTDVKYGFIAQEVETVIPNLVHKNKGINRVSKDSDKQGYGQGEIVDDYSDAYKDDSQSEWSKSVEKTGIIPILVEALKDSISKIETLEAEVAALKAQ